MRDERTPPGSHELPPSEPETDRQALLFAVLRGERDALSLAEVAPLLDVDEWYHLLASKLPEAVSDTDIDRRVLDWLNSDDPTQRARAVRWVGAVESGPRKRFASDSNPKDKMEYLPDAVPSVEGIDTFERFVQAIPTVDATTQRLVAPALWEPWILGREEPPEPSHVQVLTELVDADLPEIRVGALHGSSRLVGELVLADRVESEPTPATPPTPGVEAFCDAYITALSDDHPMVLARAVEMASSWFAGYGYSHPAVGLENLQTEIPLETAWKIGRGLARLTEYDSEGMNPEKAETYFEIVSECGPEGIEKLVTYGYEQHGPMWELVRETLADRAKDEPALLAEHIDAPLAAVRTGPATIADLTLLQTLVPARPERVATAGDGLAELLDDSRELRQEAAWTLVLLGRERPDAVPVERDRLVEILSEVRDRNGRFRDSERLRRLAVADLDRAGVVLVKLAEAVAAGGTKDGWEVRASQLGDALSAVASGATDVGASFPEIPPDRHEAFVGVARGATYKTVSFTDIADVLIEHLDSMTSGADHVNLEALATALVAIGQRKESALPQSVRPILDRADDVYDPDELDELVERVREGDRPEARDDHPIKAVNDDLLAYEW